MSSVWDMILQWGSFTKVSIDLPVATLYDWKIVEYDINSEQTIAH